MIPSQSKTNEIKVLFPETQIFKDGSWLYGLNSKIDVLFVQKL